MNFHFTVVCRHQHASGSVARSTSAQPFKRLGSFGETMEHRRFMITDDPKLRFVLIEIELGITFVQTALNAYYSGHDEHGDSAKANAIKALGSAGFGRLLHRADHPVSDPVRVPGAGTRPAPDSALRRNGASDGRMDRSSSSSRCWKS
jgi:hypothetical protein